MKTPIISSIRRNIGMFIATGAVAVLPLSMKAQSKTLPNDTFTYTQTATPKGTAAKTILLSAPSPKVTIAGQNRLATFVIDLAQNVLYHYDEKGQVQMAYLVASGKKTTPTSTGVRMVTHVESYPYKSAPAYTKRRKRPWDYGPRIICLETVDPKTGAKGVTGEFIHGNNNVASLGKYASKGCIRMDNEVIKRLAKEVKRGAIVVIKNTVR